MNETQHEKEIYSALVAFKERIDDILNFIVKNKTISREEKEFLQEKLTSLKEYLKFYSKLGKLKKDKNEQTAIESAIFEPAVTEALLDLKMKTNSDPHNSNWVHHLTCASFSIQYYLPSSK